MKEDLYEQIVNDPWSADPDFTIDGVGTSDIINDYKQGLSVIKEGGEKQAITAISKASSAVLSVEGHGYADGDLITILGESGDDEWDRLFLYNQFKVAEKETDTFELLTNVVNQYLKEPLAYYAFALGFYRIMAEASEMGIHILAIDKGQTPDTDVREQYLKSLYKTADTLMGEAVDYIQEQSYTEYEGTEGDEQYYTERVMMKGNTARITHI